MSREIFSPPSLNLEKNLLSRLEEYSKEYTEYSTKTEPIRRRLVTSTRQYLFELIKQLSPQVLPAKSKLRFHEEPLKKPSSSSISCSRLTLNSPLNHVKGISKKISAKLMVFGIFLVKDLLEYYPRDYIDYSSLLQIKELKEGESATLVASVRRCSCFKSPRNRNLSILELQLYDQTGRIRVTRFFAGRRFSNSTYIHKQTRLYPSGATVAVSGMVKNSKYGITFTDPLIEVLESKQSKIKSKSIGRLLPIYSLTEGLSASNLRDIIEVVLPLAKQWPDFLSKECLSIHSLITKSEAITAIHNPYNQIAMNEARRRLVFDEFLILQLSLLRRRLKLRQSSSPPLSISWESDGLVARFLKLLPFTFTNAQRRVLVEIEADLSKPEPMSRLVQGDVGSGKTVVAIAALLNAVQSGWQGAFMAPTEVLANQHYKTLCKWLTHLHVTVELLTGSTTSKQRGIILNDLSNGSLKILVGTHALIEDSVSFLRLGLVVVDEQHRFGVHQRNRLLSKGLQPHLLTMTATPIPRTLALSLHGDLDVSQIDELPPNRTPIKTNLLSGAERDDAYHLIREEVKKGQRAYFVLPLVEESEKLDLRSAIEVHKQLTEEVFPEFVVGLLHGRMKSADKQSAINDFVLGKSQILVSTTVVEVGVDVPEATVMVIDHADRFGLAQLHQLRGRVGRGAKTSYCLLINDSRNDLAKHRLEVLVNSNDGFEIAEIDLRLRGPGQVLGTRQSGLPDFALASLIKDQAVLEEAREEAVQILKLDPELTKNLPLRKIIDEHWVRLMGAATLN